MEETKSIVIEEIGFKAYKKGFFKEWREYFCTLNKNIEFSPHEAAQIAYHEIKEKKKNDKQK